MHLNLPPDGTPEYWRAVRQLVMRAKVDVDRLWGRQEQYASQGVLENATGGGLPSGKAFLPIFEIDVTGRDPDSFEEFLWTVPADAPCWPLGIPTGAASRMRFRINSNYLNTFGGVAAPAGTIFTVPTFTNASQAMGPAPEYPGMCVRAKSIRQSSGLLSPNLGISVIVYFTGTSELYFRLTNATGRFGYYTLCGFDCSNFIGVEIPAHPDSHSDCPTSITLLGYS